MAVDLNDQFAANISGIGQQGIMNNQGIAHHTQTQTVNHANKITPFDMVGLSGVERSVRPNDFASLNTADRVPVAKTAPKTT